MKAVNRINAIAGLYGLRAKAMDELADGAAPAALAESLAENKGYVAKVRWAYDEVVRTPGDKTKMGYEDMLKGLTQAGMIVDTVTFDAQFKEEHAAVSANHKEATQRAMQNIAVLPLIMAVCYISLMIYFRAKGGYKAIDLDAEGHKVGEHPVTPAEAVADAEATPSE